MDELVNNNFFDICEKNNFKKIIEISNNQNFDYKFLVNNQVAFDITFEIISESSGVVNLLLLSKDNLKISGNLNINIRSPKANVEVVITSLIGKDGFVDVNGNVFIDFDTNKSVGNLLQRSIYISDSGISKFTPSLFINCNDVKASHGGKVERLDDDKLFYISSKGIDKLESKKLMISSYINEFFGDLEGNELKKEKLLDYIIDN